MSNTINGCGSPIYTVPANQPTVRVTAKYSQAPGLQDQMNAVPVPPNAIASQNCKD